MLKCKSDHVIPLSRPIKSSPLRTSSFLCGPRAQGPAPHLPPLSSSPISSWHTSLLEFLQHFQFATKICTSQSLSLECSSSMDTWLSLSLPWDLSQITPGQAVCALVSLPCFIFLRALSITWLFVITFLLLSPNTWTVDVELCSQQLRLPGLVAQQELYGRDFPNQKWWHVV